MQTHIQRPTACPEHRCCAALPNSALSSPHRDGPVAVICQAQVGGCVEEPTHEYVAFMTYIKHNNDFNLSAKCCPRPNLDLLGVLFLQSAHYVTEKSEHWLAIRNPQIIGGTFSSACNFSKFSRDFCAKSRSIFSLSTRNNLPQQCKINEGVSVVLSAVLGS